MTTQDVLNYFCSDTKLSGRGFGSVREGYKVAHRSCHDMRPRMVARYKDGVIEVPSGVMSNGYSVTFWAGEWYPVPENEFIKDFGWEYIRSLRLGQ